MALHSIYGSSAPPGTWTLYADGSPSIRLGNVFYRFGSGPLATTAVCTGAKLWTPDGATGSVTFHAYTGSDAHTAAPMAGSPIQSKTAVANAGGWTSVTWDVPFNMPPIGSPVLIAYQWSDNVHYVVSTDTRGISTAPVLDTDNDLVWAGAAENDGSAFTQAYFKIGSGAGQVPAQGYLSYGTDIIVSDSGTGAPTYDPITFDVARTSDTTATLAWDDPGDALNGISVLRAPGNHTVDGNSNPFGDPDYDPTTIPGSSIVANGVSSPYVDTGLDSATDYTYAIIRTT